MRSAPLGEPHAAGSCPGARREPCQARPRCAHGTSPTIQQLLDDGHGSRISGSPPECPFCGTIRLKISTDAQPSTVIRCGDCRQYLGTWQSCFSRKWRACRNSCIGSRPERHAQTSDEALDATANGDMLCTRGLLPDPDGVTSCSGPIRSSVSATPKSAST